LRVENVRCPGVKSARGNISAWTIWALHFALWIASASYTQPALATASRQPFEAVGTAHFIIRHADTTAYTLQLRQGIRPGLDASLDYTRIEEGGAIVELAGAQVAKRFGRGMRPEVQGFGGVRYLTGTSTDSREFEELAAQAGLVAKLPLSGRVAVRSSAAFSFFERTLQEFEASVAYRISQDLSVDAGYKAYRAGSRSIGGPTLSMVWRR